MTTWQCSMPSTSGKEPGRLKKWVIVCSIQCQFPSVRDACLYLKTKNKTCNATPLSLAHCEVCWGSNPRAGGGGGGSM